MSKIFSDYTIADGTKLYYEIFENGFDIFAGENATYPLLHQPEPYIPNPDLSYEENAKKMCEQLSIGSSIPRESELAHITVVEYTQLSANIDYLLLLNE